METPFAHFKRSLLTSSKKLVQAIETLQEIHRYHGGCPQIYEVNMRSSEHQALARRMVAESVFRRKKTGPWKGWMVDATPEQGGGHGFGWLKMWVQGVV